MIGENIEIRIIEVRGDQVKIGIEAPEDVKVYRKEIYIQICQENKEAARAVSDITLLNKLVKNQKNNEKQE